MYTIKIYWIKIWLDKMKITSLRSPSAFSEGNNLKPAVALIASGVFFQCCLGTKCLALANNWSIDSAPYNKKYNI